MLVSHTVSAGHSLVLAHAPEPRPPSGSVAAHSPLPPIDTHVVPVRHAMPQVPQLFGSELGSMQSGPQQRPMAPDGSAHQAPDIPGSEHPGSG
jgi:hypothetical protein